MRRHGLTLIMLVLQLACLAISPNTDAEAQKPTVNILTWWGYLDDPALIARAENDCHVKISHDNYYSNDEFLRRWSLNADNYDVIIFSNTIYNIIGKKLISIQHSPLSSLSSQYNPIIRKHYQESHFPNNIAYFAHALTGIFYNPKNIDVTTNDTDETLFNKSNGNIVVLLDDAVEMNNFFNQATITHSKKEEKLNFDAIGFKKMCKKSDVYVANDLSSLFFNKKFSFSFLWSGEGITEATKHPGFRFVILPSISYISTDLIAQTTDKQSAQCVALTLSQKQTLNAINRENNYFPPYAELMTDEKTVYWETYNTFLKSLAIFDWITPPNLDQFNHINQQWNKIKLSLLTSNQ